MKSFGRIIIYMLYDMTAVCSVTITEKTSGSAVAERLRDALCPSVVSLNKIITRVESFIIVTWASDLSLCNIVFGLLLRLFVIHFVLVSHHQQTPPLTSEQCYKLAMVRHS